MATAITVQEKTDDLKSLSNSHYNLQVAKSVSSPGSKALFNVVYDSKDLVPNMEVSWTQQYGINWTTEIASPGAKVIYTGNWQACNLGDSYNLTSVGEWEINNDDPHKDKDSVNVGLNGYTQPVNIIVGIQDPGDGDWQAVCYLFPDLTEQYCYGVG